MAGSIGSRPAGWGEWMRDDPVFPEGTGGGKVVRTQKRFTVDGLANLRVLMDALLPKVFDGGLQGDGTFTGQPENGILRPGRQSAVGPERGMWERPEVARSLPSGGSRSLSQSADLAVARGDREVVRKRMDRYYIAGACLFPG